MECVTGQAESRSASGDLPLGLLEEILSHLPQQDRVNACLVNRSFNAIATKLLYRRIYLNDSNVVRSDIMNLAINWTLLYVPNRVSEERAREVANRKLQILIRALKVNKRAVRSVEWVRINWDLNSVYQKTLLSIVCNEGTALQRLENVIDPSCNDIIANGRVSGRQLTSFDMAPPHPNAGVEVNTQYIPNLRRYLSQRISSSITYMNLFMDPLTLFEYLYPLRDKLQVVDLKLHWRLEYFPAEHFIHKISQRPLHKLSDIFDPRSLKVLTIVSWHEYLLPKELDIIKQLKDFTTIEDLSLISIEQETLQLMNLFSSLPRLKRLKTDFIEQLSPQSTKPELFMTILQNCRELEFLDLRFEGLDAPIINVENGEFQLTQKCHCSHCMHVFDSIIRQKLFLFPEDYFVANIADITTKDIFRMMRFHCLLPYSKACDYYPSVRTYPMDIDSFVLLMNGNLKIYRASRDQLIRDAISLENNDLFLHEIDGNDVEMVLPHKPITRQDILDCYHALVHHQRRTYIALLTQFPKLRFLVLNDIASVVVNQNNERILQPVFYNEGFVSNLSGWTENGNVQRDSAKFMEKSALYESMKRLEV